MIDQHEYIIAFCIIYVFGAFITLVVHASINKEKRPNTTTATYSIFWVILAALLIIYGCIKFFIRAWYHLRKLVTKLNIQLRELIKYEQQ